MNPEVIKPIIKPKQLPIRHAIYLNTQSSSEIMKMPETTESPKYTETIKTIQTKPKTKRNDIPSIYEKKSLFMPLPCLNLLNRKIGKVVASFDVGIKHLAYCILSSSQAGSYNIHDWGIINLLEENETVTCEHYFIKTNALCGKKASYFVSMGSDSKKYLCGIHIKKEEESLVREVPPIPNVNTIDIQTLCMNLVRKLDNKPIFLEVDEILIEQQPTFGSSHRSSQSFKGKFSPGVHPRMKNLSYMIYSYFIMRGLYPNTNQIEDNLDSKNSWENSSKNCSKKRIKSVKFVNSYNKLKVYDGPELIVPTIKSIYERNKFLAREHVKYILRDQPDLLHFFDGFTKKDDLADCFLQGAHYLSKS